MQPIHRSLTIQMQAEEQQNNQSTGRINWHSLFETVNLTALTDVGLKVDPEYRLMSESPVVDILLQRGQAQWTGAQLARLPDGVRHSKALYMPIDLKKTESLNERMLFKTLAYDSFFKVTQNLKNEEVQTFLLSAKTPQKAFFAEFEYEVTEHAGVYDSHNRAFRYVKLIVLNQLSDEPHNAFFKCFASRKKEASRAFESYFQSELSQYPSKLTWYMLGLREKILGSEGGQMDQESMTPESILANGRQLAVKILHLLPREEVLKSYKPEEIFSHYKPEEIFSHYKPEEIFSQYKPEEIFSHYKPEEVFSRYSLSELEAYVKQRQREELQNGH